MLLAPFESFLALAPSDRRVLGRLLEMVEVRDCGYETPCWAVRAGEKTDKGYARIYVGGGKRPVAHRWLWKLLVGPLGDEIQLDHLCRQKACVRLDHLEPVTALEHNRRTHAPITHCPKGHPYDDVNTRWYQGRRYCRTCNNNGRRPVANSRLKHLHAERRRA